MTGYTRFREIMNENIEADDNGAIDVNLRDANIEFKNVCFKYAEGKEVLKNLSFVAEKNKTTALVGSSGCGKTTICHLMMRFYEKSSGEILVGGYNIENLTRHSLRKNIGIVAQDVFIFDGTIRENIAYGRLDATEKEIIESAQKAQIHNYITSLAEGYDTIVGERGIKLSGGQRQRISIARAFLKNPPILILDEATSALDNITEEQLQESLEKLGEGRTVIVVAHRLSTIQNCSKIIVLDHGAVVEEGSHASLMKKGGEYYRLYQNKINN